jgi:LysR family cyn operon transcriptional activator
METLINMLDEQNFDVALSYKPTTVHPEIESHIIFDNQLAIFVSDTHPLAARNSVRLADLEKFPFAMPAKGLQARNAFDRIINGLDYRFDIRLEINEVNLLMDLVRSSDKMVTVLSRAASVRVPGIKALTLDQQGTQMEGSFHILKNAYMKRSAKEFLRILCENRAYGLAIMDML